MKEINLIGRGSSFDIEALEDIKGLKILQSFWAPIKNQKDIIYGVSRTRLVQSYKKMGLKVFSVVVYAIDEEGKTFPHGKDYGTSWYRELFNGQCKLISVAEKIYRPPLLPPHPNWAPSGSFLPVVYALTFVAEKINIYGWDFYLDSSPEKMSYWELFFNMYKFEVDEANAHTHFESSILNFYYGYHLSKLSNIDINNHGYMGQLDKHEKLMTKIERVLFNC